MNPAILDSLVPVLMIAALGALLRGFGFLSAQAVAELNRLTYWVGLPVLMFVELTTAPFALGEAAALFAVVFGATVVVGTLAWRCAAWFGATAAVRGTFAQAVFRGNLALVGLPVVMYAFAGNEGVRAVTMVVLAPLFTLYSVFAVLALQASRPDRGSGKRWWRGLATNPILVANVLGLACVALGWTPPTPIARGCKAIGQMALPLGLIGIGGSLVGLRLRGRLLPLISAAVLKVVALPLVGVLLAWFAGLSAEHTRIALLLLAVPTATASYVLAVQLGGDEALASSSILLSTLLSAPVLALVLAFG